jgi:pantoate--beta-alanine ligase
MKIIEDVGVMEAFSKGVLADGGSVVLVPTMGALHGGHRELFKRGRGVEGAKVVASIFVNPAQFGPDEDFISYPRDLEGDLRIVEAEGVDAVFCPGADGIFPEDFDDYVEVGRLGELLCGASRPGHFRGVATVVRRLFGIVDPSRAFFGRKDFQQLRVIEEMVAGQGLNVDIVGVETVREPDGLAMSSRNRYLSKTEREAAASIPMALRAASALFKAGVRKGAEITAEVRAILEEAVSSVDGALEYVSVVDIVTLEEVDIIKESTLVAVAARFGASRLIDNLELC